MIVVCERLASGRVQQHQVIQELEAALTIARTLRTDLHRTQVWIERREEPASKPTLDQAAHRTLRWSRPDGLIH